MNLRTIVIAKEPIARSNSSIEVTFTSDCRNAMKQIYMSIIKKNPASYILVPSYIGLSKVEGSGVFDPLVESKMHFKFYNVNHELEPDLLHISQLIQEGQVGSILVINYFGKKPRNFEALITLCKINDILTIEDNAHCLPRYFDYLYQDNIPMDFAVFSIHKYLGTESGGILLSKKSGENTFENSINMNDLIAFSSSNFRKIAEQRRINLLKIRDFLQNYESELLGPFFERDHEDIDYLLNFPVRFSSKEARHLAFTNLSNKGIYPTALYHRLIPQISYEEYPVSMNVSDTIMNLPTHQNASELDIETMMLTLKSGYIS